MSLLDEVKAATARAYPEAGALPLGAYSDPELFELERKKLVYHSWIAICPASALPEPGDYFAVDLAGEPVMVIRGEDGELRALSSVCRHRGTPLTAEGHGSARTFICPFHAWSYDSSGKLLAVPHPGTAKIDRATHCLPQFQLVVWRNLVFINLDENPEPFTHSVEGVEKWLEKFGFDGEFADIRPELQHWNSNWKLASENGMEPYHLQHLHRNSVGPILPLSGVSYLEGSPRWTVYSVKMVGDFEREHTLVIQLHPFVNWVLQPALRGQDTGDAWTFLTTLPGPSPETSTLIVGFGDYESEFDAGRAGAEGSAVGFLHEDEVQCELQQRATHTRSTHRGQYVELERILVDYHNNLAWRVFDCPPEKPWIGSSAARRRRR